MDPLQDEIDARNTVLADAFTRTPVECLGILANIARGQAFDIETRRKRGWQSAQKPYLATVEVLESWADEMRVERRAPLREPLAEISSPDRTADLDPAAGPLSGQITDRVLAMPELCRAEYPHRRGARIVKCGRRAGHDLPPSPLRHAEWIEDGTLPEGGDWGPEWDLPTEVTTVTAGGYVTHDVARAVREAPDVDAKLDVAFGPLADATRAAINALPDVEVTMTGTIDVAEPAPRPERMTWAQVVEHAKGRTRRQEKRSYSQVSSFGECPTRYALSDLDRTPCWWLVGGRAVHFAMEQVNLYAVAALRTPAGAPPDLQIPEVGTLWDLSLNRAVAEAMKESGMPDTTQWKAADKGKENHQWWRAEGIRMVQHWISRLTRLLNAGWRILVIDGTPCVEWEIIVDAGGVPLVQIIDVALHNPSTGEVCVVDAKTGKSKPDDPRQLGQYAHAVAQVTGHHVGMRPNRKITAAWWMARTDEVHVIEDPRAEVPWDDIVYETVSTHRADMAGLYLPIRQYAYGGCNSCGVKDYCPAGPR